VGPRLLEWGDEMLGKCGARAPAVERRSADLDDVVPTSGVDVL
jgi:hypothetical protein